MNRRWDSVQNILINYLWTTFHVVLEAKHMWQGVGIYVDFSGIEVVIPFSGVFLNPNGILTHS